MRKQIVISLTATLLLTACATDERFVGKKPLSTGPQVVTTVGTPIVVYGQRGACNATEAPNDNGIIGKIVQIAPKHGTLSLGGEAYRRSNSCHGKVLVREIIYTPKSGFTGTETIKLSGDSVTITVK